MIEAMKQVLEVLEENLVWFSKDTMIGKALRKKTESAIATQRQAIAEAEKQEPVACPYCKNSATLGAVYYDQNCVGCVKRVTHPPEREWSDDEFIAEAKRRGFFTNAAHGIKGEE